MLMLVPPQPTSVVKTAPGSGGATVAEVTPATVKTAARLMVRTDRAMVFTSLSPIGIRVTPLGVPSLVGCTVTGHASCHHSAQDRISSIRWLDGPLPSDRRTHSQQPPGRRGAT